MGTLCKTIIAPFAGTKNPKIAERVLRTCLLTPTDGEMIKSLDHFDALTSESIGSTASGAGVDSAAWHAYSLAMMAFRRGDYVSATNWCQRSLSFDNNVPCREAGVRLIRAMALTRLGEMEQARGELAASRKIVENPTNQSARGIPRWQGFWFDWAFDRALLREAKDMIESAP